MREALGANRDLQAARLAIDVARGQRLQAGRLENPELELGYVDDFAFADEGERAASAGFAQRFPVTARLARERDVAGQDVEIAEAEVRNFVRTLIADVEGVFYTVRALDERRATNAPRPSGRGARVTPRRVALAPG
ncbi:MAG: TolC family protein [Myxococcota bacterium]|nr:TolC family protein [Myxococcota bacterium]